MRSNVLTSFGKVQVFQHGSAKLFGDLLTTSEEKMARRKTFATDPEELDHHLQPQVTKERQVSGGLGEIAAEIDDDMFRVLSQLPDEARACMLLRVIDGLTYAEISELVGIPEGTAMSHVHRGKSFARQRLIQAPPKNWEVCDDGLPKAPT